MNHQRFVVITGITRGLGLAMARGFAAAGHTVAGCGRSAAPVAELQEQLGPAHHFAKVDVANSRQVDEWAHGLLTQFGSPDILINNAAIINRNALFWDVPTEEFSRIVDINIKGVHNTIRSFLPAMLEQGRGVIVNFSSGWGRSTSPDVVPYCVTKWAIEGLSRGLADELPSGLASIALSPGVIHTEMLESCLADAASAYPSPDEWARTAVPFILGFGPEDNGQSVTVPGH